MTYGIPNRHGGDRAPPSTSLLRASRKSSRETPRGAPLSHHRAYGSRTTAVSDSVQRGMMVSEADQSQRAKPADWHGPLCLLSIGQPPPPFPRRRQTPRAVPVHPVPRRPLSRGFDPAGRPAKPLVSYQSNQQLPGWNLPPPVKRAIGAHSTTPFGRLIRRGAEGVCALRTTPSCALSPACHGDHAKCVAAAPASKRVWTDDLPAVAIVEFVPFLLIGRSVLRERLDQSAG